MKAKLSFKYEQPINIMKIIYILNKNAMANDSSREKILNKNAMKFTFIYVKSNIFCIYIFFYSLYYWFRLFLGVSLYCESGGRFLFG